jgi:hypothetical protein
MLRRSSSLAAGALWVAAGLALLPVAARADVRIEERSTALESSVTRWTSIKGDKRAIVSRAETTGVLYNAGARYGAYVEIARPDRDLIWELDPQERSYREVTFQQFSKLLQKGVQIPRNANDQPLRTLYRTEAATTTIDVQPTGKTKRIAGFDAEELVARVIVGVQNQVSGNRLNFTFDQELWVTKDERLLGEVRGFEDAYVDKFGTAISLTQAQLLAGAWNDAFIAHLRAVNDRIRALKVYPLAISTTVTEEAVAQNKGEKNTARKFTVAGMEVRKVTFDTIPDSEFELPAGYVNQDTKVAVASPLPRPEGTPPPAPSPAPEAVATPAPAPRPAPAVVTPSKPVAAAAPGKTPASPGNVASGGAGAAPAGEGAPSTAPRPAPAPVVAKVSPPAPPAPTAAVPSNVVVPGVGQGTFVPSAAPAPAAVGPNGRPQAVIVQSYTAPGAPGSYPLLPNYVVASTQAAPPVTVDEPSDQGRRRKKRKSALSF